MFDDNFTTGYDVIDTLSGGDAGGSCDAYIANVTTVVRAAESALTRLGSVNRTSASNGDGALATIVNNLAEPAVCMFGIAGNILNLIVLTRKQLQSSMDGLERSVRLGLVALAFSDMLFCSVYLMSTLAPTKFKYAPDEHLFWLYFRIYQEGLINTFQLTSTWLTVNMALGRYIAICHPLHARGYIRPRGTRIAVLAIVVLSALFNVPRFYHYHASPTPCDVLLMSNRSRNTTVTALLTDPGRNGTAATLQQLVTVAASTAAAGAQPLLKPLYVRPTGCQCFYYFKRSDWLFQLRSFRIGYGIACAFIEISLPLLLLTICNVCLIRALRRSYRMQSRYRTNQKPVDSAHRITPTLIALIVMFTVLVTPSNVLTFGSMTNSDMFSTFVAANRIANFLLLSNFAANFVLYLVVNVEFRRVARDLVTCRGGDGPGTACRRRLGGQNGRGNYGDGTPSTPGTSSTPGMTYKLTGGGGEGGGGHRRPAQTDICNISETELAL